MGLTFVSCTLRALLAVRLGAASATTVCSALVFYKPTIYNLFRTIFFCAFFYLLCRFLFFVWLLFIVVAVILLVSPLSLHLQVVEIEYRIF